MFLSLWLHNLISLLIDNGIAVPAVPVNNQEIRSDFRRLDYYERVSALIASIASCSLSAGKISADHTIKCRRYPPIYLMKSYLANSFPFFEVLKHWYLWAPQIADRVKPVMTMRSGGSSASKTPTSNIRKLRGSLVGYSFYKGLNDLRVYV